jgi:hypothetical protein
VVGYAAYGGEVKTQTPAGVWTGPGTVR